MSGYSVLPLASEEAGVAEAEPAAAEGIAAGAADDDVVDEGNVDGAGAVAEEAGDLDVGGGRGGIAAGVVVGADDGGGGGAEGLAEHLAGVGEGGGGGAGGDLDAAEEAVAAVEAEDPEFLDLEPGSDGAQVAEDLLGAGQFRGGGAGLAEQAAGELEDGEKLGGLDGADAVEAVEVGLGPAHEVGEGAGLGEEIAGEGDDVVSAGAVAEQQGEEFGVAEGSGAAATEALLGALAGEEGARRLGGGGRHLPGLAGSGRHGETAGCRKRGASSA